MFVTNFFFCPYISTFAAAFDISFLVFSIFKKQLLLEPRVLTLFFFKVIVSALNFFVTMNFDSELVSFLLSSNLSLEFSPISNFPPAVPAFI